MYSILKTSTTFLINKGHSKTSATEKFKDYRKPTVYGVGYIGSKIKIPTRESNSIIRRLYDLWANMLKRAYGGFDASYLNVTVDSRWYDFTNFLNTIVEVEGYNRFEKGDLVHLDKDIKCTGNKVYSKDTCMFVSQWENLSDAGSRRWHN